MLTKAVPELKGGTEASTQKLQAENAELKAQTAALKARLERLEKLIHDRR